MELALGLVPTDGARARAATWRELAEPAVTLVDRLGFPRTTLRDPGRRDARLRSRGRERGLGAGRRCVAPPR